jgi:hypothetical protein
VLLVEPHPALGLEALEGLRGEEIEKAPLLAVAILAVILGLEWTLEVGWDGSFISHGKGLSLDSQCMMIS